MKKLSINTTRLTNSKQLYEESRVTYLDMARPGTSSRPQDRLITAEEMLAVVQAKDLSLYEKLWKGSRRTQSLTAREVAQ